MKSGAQLRQSWQSVGEHTPVSSIAHKARCVNRYLFEDSVRRPCRSVPGAGTFRSCGHCAQVPCAPGLASSNICQIKIAAWWIPRSLEELPPQQAVVRRSAPNSPKSSILLSYALERTISGAQPTTDGGFYLFQPRQASLSHKLRFVQHSRQ